MVSTNFHFAFCISVIISMTESVEIDPANRGESLITVMGKEYPARITFSTTGYELSLTPLVSINSMLNISAPYLASNFFCMFS